MIVQVKTDKSSSLTAFQFNGEMDFNAFLAFVESLHKEPAHEKKCLWDFRSVTGGENVSVVQMGQFYGLCKAYFYEDLAHRVAFVISDEMGFGFANAMTLFEELYDVYLNVRVFKSIKGAMNWLEQGAV